MIRFNTRGAYLLWLPEGRALIKEKALILHYFLESIECETKLQCLFGKDAENWKTNLMFLDPSWLNEKAAKFLRQDKSFEGTLYSHGHNSWETETKATVFVTRVYVSN